MSALSKRRTRRLTFAAAAVAITLTLSACGTAFQSQPTKDSSNGSSLRGQTLELWGSWVKGTPQRAIWDEAIAAFTKKTGIKVNARWLGATEATTLQQAQGTGTGPDMFTFSNNALQSIPNLGDVSGVWNSSVGNGKTLGDVYPAELKKLSSVDGKVRIVPESVNVTSLWIDGKVNPEIAKNPPTTWSEFMSSLKSIKAKGAQAGLAVDGTNGNHVSRWFYWPLLRLSGPGSLTKLGATKDGSAWDSPNVLKAAQYASELVPYFLNGYQGSKFPNQETAWAKGEAAYYLNGSWVGQETANSIPAGATPIAIPFPTLPGGSKYDTLAEIGVIGWSMSATSKHKAAAEELLKFFASKKYVTLIGTKAQSIPARSDVSVPENLKMFVKQVDNAKQLTPGFDGAINVVSGWFGNVFSPLASQLMFGSITPEQFVEQGKTQTVAYWKNQG